MAHNSCACGKYRGPVDSRACCKPQPNRRNTLLTLNLVAFNLLPVQKASAATFFSFQGPWSSFFTYKPAAVSVPRKKLTLKFAVLLMRSSYQAVDDLDFIAMDKFQVKFWKLRQSEFEAYKALYDPVPVPVGELASPLYFDFISFSQFATVSQEIPDAPQVFSEFCETCGDPDGDPTDRPYRVIKRAPELADNSKLPARFQARVGNLIYAGLVNGFQGSTFGGPAISDPGCPLAELANKAQRILDIFVSNGYCISSRLSDVEGSAGGGGSWVVTTVGPANLWGLSTLQARTALVANAFDALAIQGFLAASGIDSSFQLEVSGQSIIQTWTLDRAVS